MEGSSNKRRKFRSKLPLAKFPPPILPLPSVRRYCTSPYTVFSFAIFACPLSAVCIVIFQEFVLGGLFTFLQNIVLGVLAFFAEILLARGLQLGKIAKVANILYIKVLLSQMWSMTFFGAAPTLNKLIGCLLVLASTCGTSYFGLEKENE